MLLRIRRCLRCRHGRRQSRLLWWLKFARQPTPNISCRHGIDAFTFDASKLATPGLYDHEVHSLLTLWAGWIFTHGRSAVTKEGANEGGLKERPSRLYRAGRQPARCTKRLRRREAKSRGGLASGSWQISRRQLGDCNPGDLSQSLMCEAVSACRARRNSNSRAIVPWGFCSAASREALSFFCQPVLESLNAFGRLTLLHHATPFHERKAGALPGVSITG